MLSKCGCMLTFSYREITCKIASSNHYKFQFDMCECCCWANPSPFKMKPSQRFNVNTCSGLLDFPLFPPSLLAQLCVRVVRFISGLKERVRIA